MPSPYATLAKPRSVRVDLVALDRAEDPVSLQQKLIESVGRRGRRAESTHQRDAGRGGALVLAVSEGTALDWFPAGRVLSRAVQLLLVTGAGASRRLGRDGPLPLMSDWADHLCSELDEEEVGFATACHLSSGMTGEEFEEALGLLLRWQQVRHLEARFEGLGGSPVGGVTGDVHRARHFMDQRIEAFANVLNQTLYEQFGQQRVDDDAAATAYGALLREVGAEDGLIAATTNYDRSAEAAFELLGFTVRTGFHGSHGRAPVLRPQGLGRRDDKSIPVIHLHGAVGWYERDGNVRDLFGDDGFNDSLGTPVVLYPDPDKDPTSDAIVSQLWNEFHVALEQVDHVLVLGHSLHDPALVRALRGAAAQMKVAVSYFSEADGARIVDVLPEAIPIQVDFGPELTIDRAGVAAFRS